MPIAEFGEVPGQMFGVDRMVSARDGIFHIAYHGVDPSKLFLGDTLWATTRDNASMAAPSLGYG